MRHTRCMFGACHDSDRCLAPDRCEAESLPYGPGNPDYEYDGEVQRKLDDDREKGAK